MTPETETLFQDRRLEALKEERAAKFEAYKLIEAELDAITLKAAIAFDAYEAATNRVLDFKYPELKEVTGA